MRPMWNRHRNVETDTDMLRSWDTFVFHVLSSRDVAVAVVARSFRRTETGCNVPVEFVLCVVTSSVADGTVSSPFVVFALSLSRITMSPNAVTSVFATGSVVDATTCVLVGRMDAIAASAPVANPRSMSVRLPSCFRVFSPPSSSFLPRIPCTRRVRPEKTVPSASARSGVNVNERMRMTTRANPTRPPTMMTTSVV